jgi:predicted CxxxxCH...CXXCH cytochrome family protein
VGAHRAHLEGDTSWHRAVVCDDCHLVPTGVADPGHLDTPRPAELTFGAVATARGATPVWNGTTCAGLHCHGGTLLPGGSNTEPVWTEVGTGQAACGTCHGLPPDPPHPLVPGDRCDGCHPFTGHTPDDPETHVDGTLDLAPCGSCHPVPPSTGAHATHFTDPSDPPQVTYGDLRVLEDFDPSGGPGYRFGCGACHPIDPAKHMDGTVEVELADPAAPPSSLKGRADRAAAFDPRTKTCQGVYCHSNGAGVLAFATTPPWTGTFSGDRCTACHQNPPAYPSGGAGSETANSHLLLASDGYEYGHFGGLPGPWHTSHHRADASGVLEAAPITCQTCHFETVDPANVGPGGFYYLDTSGNYDLGGQLGYACATCHDGAPGSPASGSGAVLPLRHVNGHHDVVFDPRESIPADVTGLPAPPDRPTYPMWVDILPFGGLPAGSTTDGATWSLTLSGASWDPGTKTCSNVPCHLQQSYPGGPALVWGTVPVGWDTCSGVCHTY